MFRKVLKFMSKNNVSKKVERVICDNCNGVGAVDERSCPVCNGSGNAAQVEVVAEDNTASESEAEGVE